MVQGSEYYLSFQGVLGQVKLEEQISTEATPGSGKIQYYNSCVFMYITKPVKQSIFCSLYN